MAGIKAANANVRSRREDSGDALPEVQQHI
jgi:hypothetical protein